MNREQMVEKTLHAIVTTYEDCWQTFGPKMQKALLDEYRPAAVAALDAILPQVTTVAELEALHPNATLITPRGFAIRAKNVAEIDFTSGCLTVAWQPDEVTA